MEGDSEIDDSWMEIIDVISITQPNEKAFG